MTLLEQATELARQLGGPAERAACSNNLGNVLRELGRWEEAAAASGEAICLAEDAI